MRNENLNWNIKANKTLYSSLATQTSYNIGHIGQLGQTTTGLNKKDFYLYWDGNRRQLSNTLIIKVNTTTIKMDKKVKKDLS